MTKEATNPKPSMHREWYFLAVHKNTRERTFEYAGAEKQTVEQVGFCHLSFSYKTLDWWRGGLWQTIPKYFCFCPDTKYVSPYRTFTLIINRGHLNASHHLKCPIKRWMNKFMYLVMYSLTRHIIAKCIGVCQVVFVSFVYLSCINCMGNLIVVECSRTLWLHSHSKHVLMIQKLVNNQVLPKNSSISCRIDFPVNAVKGPDSYAKKGFCS